MVSDVTRRCCPDAATFTGSVNHVISHHHAAIIRIPVVDAGSTITQVRMRKWSSQLLRVVKLRIDSVAAV